MAVLLIYNKDHWLDLPSRERPDLTGYENMKRKIMENPDYNLEQRTKALMLLDMKYKARYRKGDIVEAREDGRPIGKLEKETFAFVKIPPSFDEAKEYTRTQDDAEYRRNYYLNMEAITLDEKKETTLTVSQFNSVLKVKK